MSRDLLRQAIKEVREELATVCRLVVIMVLAIFICFGDTCFRIGDLDYVYPCAHHQSRMLVGTFQKLKGMVNVLDVSQKKYVHGYTFSSDLEWITVLCVSKIATLFLGFPPLPPFHQEI